MIGLLCAWLLGTWVPGGWGSLGGWVPHEWVLGSEAMWPHVCPFQWLRPSSFQGRDS